MVSLCSPALCSPCYHFFPPSSSLTAYPLQTPHHSECQARLGYNVGSYLNRNKNRKERLERDKVTDPKSSTGLHPCSLRTHQIRGQSTQMTVKLLRAYVTGPLLSVSHSGAWWTNARPVSEGGVAIVLRHSETQTDVLGR